MKDTSAKASAPTAHNVASHATHARVPTPRWNPLDPNCPSRRLLDRIGDRWTVLILVSLRSGPARFSQLRREVGGISEKMLSQTLHALVRDGLIVRHAYAEIPPRVEYQLTDLGQSLLVPLTQLFTWAVEHMDEVAAHHQAADKAEG